MCLALFAQVQTVYAQTQAQVTSDRDTIKKELAAMKARIAQIESELNKPAAQPAETAPAVRAVAVVPLLRRPRPLRCRPLWPPLKSQQRPQSQQRSNLSRTGTGLG